MTLRKESQRRQQHQSHTNCFSVISSEFWWQVVNDRGSVITQRLITVALVKEPLPPPVRKIEY